MYAFKLPEYKCPRCGMKVSGPGECIICLSETNYQRGLKDGKEKAKYESNPLLLLRCSECGQYPNHTYSCSINPYKYDFRSDYEKGFDAGYKSAKSSSASGRDEFLYEVQ